MLGSDQNSRDSVLQRVACLPLFSSALRAATSAYVDLKGRYPLMGLVGGVAMLSVRGALLTAARRSEPLLQRLEPQISMANNYACVGLDQLEKRFPILQQSAEEVVSQLKDIFFLTLDDLQLRLNEGVDRVTEGMEQLVEWTRDAVEEQLSIAWSTPLGGAVALALDDLLTRLEDTMEDYLPLPSELQSEWKLRLQLYEEEEDDDDNEEPSLWTRARCLGLRVGLFLQHWAQRLREVLLQARHASGAIADMVGLSLLAEAILALAQGMLAFYMARVHQLEDLRSAVTNQFSALLHLLLGLAPVRSALAVPGQLQVSLTTVLAELWELCQILIQWLINSTPLYNMLEQPSQEQLEEVLHLEENLLNSCSSRRGSDNTSLLPKGTEVRARRRSSLYGRSRRSSASANGAPSPAATPLTSNSRRSSLKQDGLSSSPPGVETPAANQLSFPRHRSSTTETLLSPIMQIVTQSQQAFNHFSPGPAQEKPGASVEESAET